jgi:hypothetical protein
MEQVNRNKTHNGRGKGKPVQEQASSDTPLTGHTREPNWNNEETQRVLNAIEDAQLHYVKKDLKFVSYIIVSYSISPHVTAYQHNIYILAILIFWMCCLFVVQYSASYIIKGLIIVL